MSIPKVTAIILAGGKSRRMGKDKAFLDFNGKPLIAHVIERVTPVCSEVIIIANDRETYAQFGLRVVGDVYPDRGSLGGLYSGLLAARAEYVLAIACDMPFVNQDLLRYMISLAPQSDVVIPRAHDPSSVTPRSSRERRPRAGTVAPRFDQPLAKEQNLHPTHAIYSKRCLPTIAEYLRADDLRLIGFLSDVQTRVVEANEIDPFDPQHLSFFNANTPEDFEIAKRLSDNV